jgi:molybdate transport system substrate-binding protein
VKNPLIHLRPLLLFLALGAANLSLAQQPPRPELLVFAAASLTDVLGELSAAYERHSGVRVKLSFAASSVLARQIEAGTSADVFVSADQEWMDYLEQRQRLTSGSRRNLAGNRLALIAPADSRIALTIMPGFPLAAALGEGRLATGDPDTVPVGRYARAALTKLGVWDEVQARIARADNVRTALMYVARGETPLGIVYATDAAMEPKVRIVGIFPAGLHAPITYPAAAMRGAKPAAKAYLDFLVSRAAGATWKQFRFEERSPVPGTAK